jgi:tRNA acetyltransferase TAN1
VYIVVLEPLDPVRLVEHILAKCESTARCNMRFVQRLTPIARTGPGNKTKLAELAKEILPAAFHTEDGSGLKVS